MHQILSRHNNKDWAVLLVEILSSKLLFQEIPAMKYTKSCTTYFIQNIFSPSASFYDMHSPRIAENNFKFLIFFLNRISQTSILQIINIFKKHQKFVLRMLTYHYFEKHVNITKPTRINVKSWIISTIHEIVGENFHNNAWSLNITVIFSNEMT